MYINDIPKTYKKKKFLKILSGDGRSFTVKSLQSCSSVHATRELPDVTNEKH